MPCSYLIDVARGVVFTRGWGVLTDAEILAHARTLRPDSRFDPGLGQVVDFTGVGEVRVTSVGVRAVAQENPFRRDARRAFVAPSDEVVSLTRLFGLFTDSDMEQFKIFHAMERALEWVGLDPATPWPEGEEARFEIP